MAHFEDLVAKLMTDQTFSNQFHDKDKSKRDAALKSIGIDPGHPGLKDALDKVNYDAIDHLRTVLVNHPNKPVVRPFN
jgi:hypothetical protein